MKHLHRWIWIAIAWIGILPANAYDFYKDGFYYNIYGETSAMVTYDKVSDSPVKTYSGDVIIPSSVTYNGKVYPVTVIGPHAFENCTDLTSVTIPESVTVIMDYAFRNCTSLTSITIHKSVTKIDHSAFERSSELQSITVAADNPCYTSLDGVLFNKDKTTLLLYPEGKQGAYTIPNHVKTIGRSAFSNCKKLTSVTIPNSVTEIGASAFMSCWGLTSVTIPNSVTEITGYSFWGCWKLVSVTIPESVTSIGSYAFDGCNYLESIQLLGKTPPTLRRNSFSSYEAKLHVPQNCIQAYQNAEYWGKFSIQ